MNLPMSGSNSSLLFLEATDCEKLLNELLLHVDLLGETVQFLPEIGNISSLDQQDKTKWKDLENVYSEVEKEFVYLYNDC